MARQRRIVTVSARDHNLQATIEKAQEEANKALCDLGHVELAIAAQTIFEQGHDGTHGAYSHIITIVIEEALDAPTA